MGGRGLSATETERLAHVAAIGSNAAPWANWSV